MIARISRALHDRLLALAAAEPAREVCGLLLGEPGPVHPVRPEPVEGRAASGGVRGTSFECARDERVSALQPAPNIAVDPVRTFELDPATLFAALKAERAGGPRVLGHYHSHPSGQPAPSPRDAAQARDAGRLWLIVGEGRLTAWRAVPGGSIHGAFEPVTLHIEPDCCETGHRSPQGAAQDGRKDRG